MSDNPFHKTGDLKSEFTGSHHTDFKYPLETAKEFLRELLETLTGVPDSHECGCDNCLAAEKKRKKAEQDKLPRLVSSQKHSIGF
jgi:hypothetical protein